MSTPAKLPLPERLDGRRCLHVALPGAPWAAELARRGAGEVAGITVARETPLDDLPELEPTHNGHFDLVVLDRVLAGQRDPVRLLERARSLCADTVLVVADVDLVASVRYPRRAVARLDGREGVWWQPNRAALLRMLESARFTVEEATGVQLAAGTGHRRPRLPDLRSTPYVAVRGRPA